MKDAREHIKFCIELYRSQIASGRFFMHEHPHSASSWQLPEVMELLCHRDVESVTCDMCAYGMVSEDENGIAPAQKRTRIMSNSPEVLKRVGKQCTNKTDGEKAHRHVQLLGGRAKKCQVYPKAFCQAVCEGVAAEKKLRALGMAAQPIMSVSEMQAATGSTEEEPDKALHEEDGTVAFDDQSGAPLIPGEVAKARQEEIEYFRSMGVYRKVDKSVCWEATGKAPIPVRWVDINKGDNTSPNYRSRLVAKEFRTDVRPDLYAATPPSECLKLLLSRLSSTPKMKLMYADVSRAYFYAKAVRPVYVVLPAEDFCEGDEDRCGELVMSMYGTRDAALNWSTEYTKTLTESGYVQGRASPCLFYNVKLDVAIMVHGDDFVAIGDDKGLGDARKVLEHCYKLKVEILGEGKGCVKEVRILNKIVRHTSEGIEMEADPRHAELVVRELGLEKAKTFNTPGTKEGKRKTDDKEVHRSRLGNFSGSDHDDDENMNLNVLELLKARRCGGKIRLDRRSGLKSASAARRGHSYAVPIGVLNEEDWLLGNVGLSGGTAACRPQVGSRVGIRCHGFGTVIGFGCCGQEANRIHVQYDQGHKFHCKAEQITSIDGSLVRLGARVDEPVMSAAVSSGDLENHDDDDGDDLDVDELLGRAEASQYRAVAARLNYLAPDRMDIQYAVKEAARSMSAPKRSDWAMVNRIGRYLLGRPRLVMHFKWQNPQSTIVAFTDSDWAGCVRTARSTSGGIVTIGSHVIKTYSRQQKTVALSSAEAELYAMVAASAETLAIIAYAQDLGTIFKGEIYTDSSAALGISLRAGIGKVRHLRTQGLWVQEARSTGRLSYLKVLGTKNPADVLTKHVPAELLNRHLESMGVSIDKGRAESALGLNAVVESYVEWVEFVRGAGGRMVSFSEKVHFRAVKSENKGRKCKNIRKTPYKNTDIEAKEVYTVMAQKLDKGNIPRGSSAGMSPRGSSAGAAAAAAPIFVRSEVKRWADEPDESLDSLALCELGAPVNVADIVCTIGGTSSTRSSVCKVGGCKVGGSSALGCCSVSESELCTSECKPCSSGKNISSQCVACACRNIRSVARAAGSRRSEPPGVNNGVYEQVTGLPRLLQCNLPGTHTCPNAAIGLNSKSCGRLTSSPREGGASGCGFSDRVQRQSQTWHGNLRCAAASGLKPIACIARVCDSLSRGKVVRIYD